MWKFDEKHHKLALMRTPPGLSSAVPIRQAEGKLCGTQSCDAVVTLWLKLCGPTKIVLHALSIRARKNAPPNGSSHRLRTIRDLQLAHDVIHVMPNRVIADVESARDLLIGRPLGQPL